MFYTHHGKAQRAIYLDNNIYRLLLREKCFQENFVQFFSSARFAGLFDDVIFIFTPMQLLEAIDLGGIISKIKQLPSWKNKIDRKSIFRDSAINESLETYYNTFFMVARESEYLKSSIFSKLTEKIGLAMAYVNQDSKILLEETLLKVRDSIQTNDFKDNLASELAWAMLTSYLFIVSKEQYGTRKAYLDALICLWYKLFQSNHELQVTRLFETCYYLNVKFSGLGEGYCIPKNCKLKPESDLCDGEMIHYAYCGLKTNDVGQRIPVTGITFDCAQTIEQRRNVIRQVMTDLQRDVEGWDIQTKQGKMLALSRDDRDKLKITECTEILF